MNFFTKLAALALTATLAAPQAALAIHPHIQRQNPSLGAATRLRQRAEAVGVTFFTEQDGGYAAQVCRKGAYGMANSQKQVLICLGRHGDDWQELTDTLRHELVHIAQFCHGGPLHPERTAELLRYTDGVLGWNVRGNYPPKAWAMEAEAFTFAHLWTSEQIGDLLEEHCG